MPGRRNADITTRFAFDILFAPRSLNRVLLYVLRKMQGVKGHAAGITVGESVLRWESDQACPPCLAPLALIPASASAQGPTNK